MLRVLCPSVELSAKKTSLAKRPRSLNGKRVTFLDGWAFYSENSGFEMYPLMKELREQLEDRFELAEVHWIKKPSATRPIPQNLMEETIENSDVVINGECF